MRRWIIRALIALLSLVALLLLINLLRDDALVSGPPLPIGKVQPHLVSAWNTGVLLTPDGSLWAWGGTVAPLAHIFGHTNAAPIPQRVGTNSDWRKVAASSSHMIALKIDGSLWSWGSALGQVQSETNQVPGTPQRVGTENNWSEIAAGAAHGLALKNDGSVWTWGQNRYGQLGNSTTNATTAPTRIGDRRWTKIAAGSFNSFGLQDDGTLWGWGLDIAGGRGTNHDWMPRRLDGNTNWVALSAISYALLALREDGTLWLRGQNARFWTNSPGPVAADAFTQIGPDRKWKEIYCGEMHFIGRSEGGTWWACGENHDGQLGLGGRDDFWENDVPRPLPYDFEPWAMALGSDRGTTLVLLKDGTLWSCGIRLGEEKPSNRWDKLKMRVNRSTRRLPGHPFFTIRQFKTDTTPRRIWRWPQNAAIATGESRTD